MSSFFAVAVIAFLALLPAVHTQLAAIQIDTYFDKGAIRADIIRPSMTCARRCLPPKHLHEVAFLHDTRGCSSKAVYNHELMDNLGLYKPGQRTNGEITSSWHYGAACATEDAEECAPSYHYYAIFTKGCTVSANGTIETFNTYKMSELAQIIDTSRWFLK